MKYNQKSDGKQHHLCRDYETRSVLSLPDVGAWRYCSDPSTSVLCCAYAVDDGKIKLWVPGDPVPPEWVEASSNPNWIVSAFNNAFERAVEIHHLSQYHGWPLVPIERHRCLQASASALALPAKLERVAEALSLKNQKDMEGHRAMMALSRPRKPRKGEPPGIYWNDDPVKLQRLYAYAIQDGKVEQELQRRIGFISPAEQAVWLLDAEINYRGIHVDVELCNGAIAIDKVAHEEIEAELTAITGGAVKTVDETDKLGKWLAANGCPVDNIQKATISHALTRTKISPAARRVLELRRDGAHAAAGKYESLMAWRAHSDRVRGCFRYHGASTGRWSGLGPQPQNFKRTPEDLNVTAAITAIKTGDIEELRKLHPEAPLSIVGDVARGAIRAGAWTPSHCRRFQRHRGAGFGLARGRNR